ncbi:MAG TPA: Gfo/Idh/MocA family oxidoreductase [Clostridiaceae bacterium]|nr:Gfo/Idh/MocA family oxidoreductase [Clostridiaceae bacterium]
MVKRRINSGHCLKIALVGCGRASADHLKAIHFFERRRFVELAAIVDMNAKAIESALAVRPSRFKRPSISDNIDDILEKTSIDLTVIATPPVSHFSLAEKALNANSHLIVEKPLTLDLGEADKMIALARERKRKLAVGMKYRYIPGVREIKDFIDSGVIGDILYGSTSVRWGHDQAYYDQARWFGTWERDGGALMNQSIHAVDLMAWLMNATPLTATAVLLRQCHEMEAADLAVGTLTLCDNRLLHIEGTTNTNPKEKSASFFLRCERGTVSASIAGGVPKISVISDDGRKHQRRLLLHALKNRIKRDGAGVIRRLGNPYTFMYGDMLDAIDMDRMPLAHGEVGRDALTIVLSLFQAAREGRTVSYPPVDFALRDMVGFFD